jgi:hypothetical protein
MARAETVSRPAFNAMGAAVFAIVVAALGLIFYWMGPGFGAPDYPTAWPAPQLFPGSKGDCPDLTGSYDGVDDVAPRLLQGGPSWEQGGRPWFEHSVVVTQADDGSRLMLKFALNERGLPRHREHVMNYNQGWPHGTALTLERGKHYACSGRWLMPVNNPDVFVSKDRAGNVIIGQTRDVDSGLHYGNLEIGPQTVEKTTWRRWTARPASADAALQAVYSLEVNRFPWLNRGGHEVVAKVGNYLGEEICLRVWEVTAERADDKSANASVLAGLATDHASCPSPWMQLPHLGSINFGLRIPDVPYRIAWRPQSTPDAVVKTMEVPRPDALPLMPDQDDAKRKRATAGRTPEQLAQARARELQRTQERERELADQERREREKALAAAPQFASEDVIRQRLAALGNPDVVISEVIVKADRVQLDGNAASNAAVSQVMRSMVVADENVMPDLLSIRQQDRRIYFEIMIKPGILTAP